MPDDDDRSTASPTIGVGVVGYGYWGPRLARNFRNAESTSMVALCEEDPERRALARQQHAGIPVVAELDDLLRLPDVEAVAIATPVASHFELSRRCLERGRHVLVEKPFTMTADEACELLDLADELDLQIWVDHTYLYTPAVRRLRKVVASGELGDLLYIDSIRANLGLFQPDVDVLWDLAPHDFSILDFVIPQRPRCVSAIGRSHTPTGRSDVAYVTLDYGGDLLAHLHLNWLAPKKIRQFLIGGSSKMVQWDDTDPAEKVRLYDRGIEVDREPESTVGPDDPEGQYQTMISYRTGSVYSPWLSRTEALYTECTEFGHALLGRTTGPERGSDGRSDGLMGLRVVLLLEAASRSLDKGGSFEPIDWEPADRYGP